MYEQKNNDKRPSTVMFMIVIFILIIIILCLGVYTYNLKVELEKIKNSIAFEENEDSSNNIGVIDLNKEEKWEELNKNNSTVKTLIEKIDFPTYAVASIYNQGSFNNVTIPNDLILRLSWSKAEKKVVNGDGEYKQTATESDMENSVLNIFGTNVNYTDASFTNINVPTFHSYEENRGVVDYTGGLYQADYAEGGGGDTPFIHQEIGKVLKYSDRIELYVKTAFIDTKYNENTGDFDYILYNDFSNDEFKGKVAEMTATEFNNAYSDEENERSLLNSNSKISEIEAELNSHVYTFTLNRVNDNYCLSRFDIAM